MTTITIAAYNRPEYLRTVLQSLLVALAASGEFGRNAKIVIGIDRSHFGSGDRGLEVQAVALQFAAVVERLGYLAPEVIVWPEHLGVSEHPRRLLQYVFTELRSQFNTHLEDDTVLSPDALNLAAWYAHQAHRRTGEKVVCMSLHSRSTSYQMPRTIRFRPDFGVWGWCCSYISWWLWFSHYWNSNRTGMLGYDWSASHMLHKYGLWALEPALSRVRNIGREHGVHQTPEGHDLEMAGLVCAGTEHMRQVEEFVLDPAKPARPELVWGD